MRVGTIMLLHQHVMWQVLAAVKQADSPSSQGW
jgi:hypothetical protein